MYAAAAATVPLLLLHQHSHPHKIQTADILEHPLSVYCITSSSSNILSSVVGISHSHFVGNVSCDMIISLMM